MDLSNIPQNWTVGAAWFAALAIIGRSVYLIAKFCAGLLVNIANYYKAHASDIGNTWSFIQSNGGIRGILRELWSGKPAQTGVPTPPK